MITVTPAMPCADCLRDQGTLDECGLASVYCPHNGAVALFDGAMWEVYSPVSEPEWATLTGIA
jgi:hypothetical protein